MRQWRRPLAGVMSAVLVAVAGLSLENQAVAAPQSGPAVNPVSGNQGFLVFVQGNASLNASTVQSAVALGGDLAMSQSNLALGRVMVASSTSGALVASNADDGDVNTYWQGTTGSLPQTLTVDLGSTRTSNQIVLRLPTAFPTRGQTLSVSGSLDNVSYTAVASSASYTFNPATGNVATVSYSSTNRRYLRLTITANTAVAAGQISEFEVYAPPSGGGNAFTVASQTGGTFTAPGDSQPTGLLIGGRMNWASSAANGYINVHSNAYVKLADTTGTDVFQRTGDPTHLVVSGGGYNSQPGVSLQIPQSTASVHQSGLVDFAGAFATFGTRASELAACDNTVVLRNSGGTALPATFPPGTNAVATLTTGTQNVLNITASNLSNLATLTFVNHPSATTPLVINVYTGAVGDDFTWTPPSTNGLNDADSAFILWNFAATTRLTVNGSNPLRGTVYAPRAGLFQYDVSGVYGSVIAKSYAQGGPTGSPSGGDVRNFPFAASLQGCGAPALTITKTADAVSTAPGNTVRYTVTVTNSGGTNYTGATFTDPLTDVLDDAAYNNDASATAGTVSFASPSLNWTGNLAIGASATISYSVTVANPDTGNHRLVNTVSSTTAGTNCATGSGDSRCTANVPVASLVIEKTSDVATTVPGDTVHYTVTVTNAGQTAYTGVSVADDLAGALDDATYNADATATNGTFTFTSPNLTWTGSVAVGAAVSITFSMTVRNPDTGDKVLINVVSSAAAGNNCAVGSGDTRCRQTVGVLLPGLTITKTADATTTTRGATVHYTVTIVNSGQIAYTGAVVTDALAGVIDDAAYNNDASATAGIVAFSSPNLTWTGSLAIGAPTVTITFSVTVNGNGDNSLINVITSAAAGTNCATGSTDPRCRLNIPVVEIEIVASTVPSPTTTPGAVVRFTVVITNQSPVAQFGVVMTLDPTDVLDDAIGTGDQTATSGELTVSATGVQWTGDIPAGGVVTLTATATVFNPDTGNHRMRIVAVSNSVGSNCPTGSTDPLCAAELIVLVPELTIVKAASAATALQGGTVGYTVVVTNSGNTVYAGATVTDTLTGVLDDATYNADVSATAGAVSFTSPTLTWTGALAVGASVTITYSVTVNTPDTGDKTLANRVSSTDAGSSCPPGTGAAGCTTTVVVLVPGLTIVKTANATGTTQGAVVSYSLAITNTGTLPYTGAVVTDGLAGVIDDATYNANASATSGSVAFSSPNLTWTGNLAPGAAATVTYSVTVNNPDTGNARLTNVVTSSAAANNCPSGGGDPRCVNDIPVSILTILNVADVATTTPGGVIVHTISVTNDGQIPYVGTSVAIALADILDDAQYNGDGTTTSGVVTFDPLTTSLIWTGDLAPGEAATFISSVTVNDPDTGNTMVIAVASSAATGNNCPTGSTDPRCLSTVDVLIPELTIVKSADVTSAVAGGTVNYTIVVTNSGETPYTGAVVTDSLEHALDDAVYNNDASATAGSTSFASPDLTWTGNLALTATVTITYSLTVDSPDLGDRSLENAVTSTVAGSTCPPAGADAGCTVVLGVLIPGLTIQKSAGTTGVTAGSTVSYTITIANSGQIAYTGISVVDDLTEVLDDAAYNGDAAASTGTVGVTGDVLTWTGNVALAATVTVTYSITVDDPDSGDHSMTNTVTSTALGNNCPSGTVDPRCATTVTVLSTVLDIAVSADVATIVEGGTVRYTVSVHNTGQAPYVDAVVTNSLAGVLDDATYNNDLLATSGVVDLTGTTLTWTGDLAPEDTATITYSVTVNVPAAGDLSLVNVTTSTEVGSGCPPPGSDAGCTATTAIVERTLTLTDLTPAFGLSGTPGATVIHNDAVSMTVTTNSPTGYQVTVQAAESELAPSLSGNPTTIPVANLGVRPAGTLPFQALSDTQSALVHSQSGPSIPDGDVLVNDYRVLIPTGTVMDNYSGTLTYVAITP